MTTLRSLGKWYVPLLGIWLILVGVQLLTSLAVPPVVMGVLAVIIGVLALLAS